MSQYKHGLNQYERERVVLETIKGNPDLHHNALIKQIVPEFMAKTTFEKTRDSLLEREIITVMNKGNMKFYRVHGNFETKFQQHVERITNNDFYDLKLQIKRLETDFPHKDIDEKILIANSLLLRLLKVDNGFTVLDSAKNPKKTLYHDEHQTIQELMHETLKKIRNDKDFDIIFPSMIGNLGQILPKEN